MKDRAVRIGKFLSLVLRRRPEEVGITLDREGWDSVSGLFRAFAAHGARARPPHLVSRRPTSSKKFYPEHLAYFLR